MDSDDRDSGLYVGAGGGVWLLPEEGIKYLKDGKVVDPDPEYSGSMYNAYEVGWGVNGAVGFDFGNGPLAEAEFSYLTAGMTSHGALRDFKTNPRMASMSFMANGLYAMDTGGPLRPFLGLGIGAANTAVSIGEPKDAPEEWDSRAVFSGWGMAYQARAGFAFEIADGFSLLLGYRVYGTGLTWLSREKKLEKDDPAYDTYDTAVEILPFFGALIPPGITHRIEIGATYRLPF